MKRLFKEAGTTVAAAPTKDHDPGQKLANLHAIVRA